MRVLVTKLLFCVLFVSTIVNIKAVQQEAVECISELFQKFSRDFTVLDLTEDQNFAAQLLQKTNAIANNFCYVLFDKPDQFYLKYDNVVALAEPVSKDFLTDLAKIKTAGDFNHVDIVIVPIDTLKKYAIPVATLRPFGWHVVLLANNKTDTLMIMNKLKQDTRAQIIDECDGAIICQWPHIFSRIKDKKDQTKYTITSSYNQKTFTKKNERLTWRMGINLLSFANLKGFWPTYDQLNREIHRNFTLTHGDFRAWNLIVQGTKLVAIDGTEQTAPPSTDARIKWFKECLYWLSKSIKTSGSFDYKTPKDIPICAKFLQESVRNQLITAGYLAANKAKGYS